MSLTAADKEEIRTMMVDTISSALEEIVLPRLDRLESRMDNIESRMDKHERATNELREEIRSSTASLHRKIDQLEGKVIAIESDVKEIYGMITQLQETSPAEKRFAKLSLEQKILLTHAQLVATAKQAGVVLPS